MSSQESQRPSLYPKIDPPNPNPNYHPSSSSMYPTIDVSNLAENLFPDNPNDPSAPTGPEVESVEETLIRVPGAVVHLIDKKYSVELAIGEFSVVRIRQGANIVAVLARVADEVQWPLIKEEAVVKVDDSHYFFSISDSLHCAVLESEKGKNNAGVEEDEEVLNYGLSFASKGQEEVLKELDKVFETYGSFTVQTVSERSRKEVAGVEVAKEISPQELATDVAKREAMERNCGAYWTTLAPNVEEYGSKTARLIASGSGHVIKGILWCGDVTVDRLKWGQEVFRKRLDPGERKQVDKNTLRRIKRAKRMTKMTKKVATSVLSGVVRVSGFFTSSVANSKVGKKFFSLLPGEMVLASLDGFNRICDAVEVAGKEVMSTTSTVTTGLVTHKYGEEYGKATHEGLGAAGHAIGTAWTVFKIRKALNPKGALKPTSLAKSAVKAAASEYKSQKGSK